MTRRRPRILPRTCVCGMTLRWVRYTPKAHRPDEPRLGAHMRALDRLPVVPQVTTGDLYAVTQGTNQARLITESSPLDPVVEWGPYTSHLDTCPQHVTTEQLASMREQNGRPR